MYPFSGEEKTPQQEKTKNELNIPSYLNSDRVHLFGVWFLEALNLSFVYVVNIKLGLVSTKIKIVLECY